jgi:DNA ligase (NAD+)
VFEFKPTAKLGDAAGRRFIKSREAAKKQSLARKLHALGIEGFGAMLTRQFTAKWQSLDDVVWTKQSLAPVLGDMVSDSVLAWFTDNNNLVELDKLEELGVIFKDTGPRGKLAGQVFCITGSMASGSRDDVASKIEKAGGLVKASVGKKVNYLVVGPGGGKNKAEAAEKYGTKCISETELYELLGEPLRQAVPDIEEL